MNRSVRKIVQYLHEARAAELGQRRELQSQIGVTPPGRYRTVLERHLKQTIRHGNRIGDRLAELGETRGPLQVGLDTASTLADQLLSIGRAPFELVRGPGGEERVLRNARDTCAAEAIEIATYTALERLARDAEDRRTAKLAAWIRAEEEAMLGRILAEIPTLTDALAGASFEITPPRAITQTAGSGARSRVSLRGLDDADRASSVAARRTRSAASEPAAREPWADYDQLDTVEVIAALDGASAALVKRVRGYERIRKQRPTVIQATERELARS